MERLRQRQSAWMLRQEDSSVETGTERPSDRGVHIAHGPYLPVMAAMNSPSAIPAAETGGMNHVQMLLRRSK